MRRLLTALLLSTLAFAAVAGEHNRPASYFDNTGREDAWQEQALPFPENLPQGQGLAAMIN